MSGWHIRDKLYDLKTIAAYSFLYYSCSLFISPQPSDTCSRRHLPCLRRHFPFYATSFDTPFYLCDLLHCTARLNLSALGNTAYTQTDWLLNFISKTKCDCSVLLLRLKSDIFTEAKTVHSLKIILQSKWVWVWVSEWVSEWVCVCVCVCVCVLARALCVCLLY